jgi:hypothetical protein
MCHRLLLSNIQSPSAIVATLDALGYRSITDEIVAEIVSDAVYSVFNKLGEHITALVIRNLCKINNRTEQQLFRRCDLVEGSIRAMFGRAADFFIDEIKDELVPFSLAKKPGLSLEEIANEMREVEVMRFVGNLAGHEHVGFIYNRKATKDAVLSQFFDHLAAPRTQALISLSSCGAEGKSAAGKFEKVQSIITYDEFLKVKEKSEAMDVMFKWIWDIHKSNQSGRETRIAGEDASWFLRNGFENEFLDAERMMGRRLHDKMSVLCSYDAEGITLASQLKRVIESHRYVIIEQPMAVYVAPA